MKGVDIFLSLKLKRKFQKFKDVEIELVFLN